jgi:hypothetical protein
MVFTGITRLSTNVSIFGKDRWIFPLLDFSVAVRKEGWKTAEYSKGKSAYIAVYTQKNARQGAGVLIERGNSTLMERPFVLYGAG